MTKVNPTQWFQYHLKQLGINAKVKFTKIPKTNLYRLSFVSNILDNVKYLDEKKEIVRNLIREIMPTYNIWIIGIKFEG